MEQNKIKSPILEAEGNLHDIKGTENREDYSLGEFACIQGKLPGRGATHGRVRQSVLWRRSYNNKSDSPEVRCGITLQGHW